MKKYNRQRIILDLIENNEIETQEELAEHLLENGINITQATISRDIKELRLVKVLTSEGKYKYATINSQYDSVDERISNVFKSTVLSIDKAENMIVLKTLPGAASICAMAIDSLKIEGIVGTVSGNDTIFAAISEIDIIDSILTDIKELLK